MQVCAKKRTAPKLPGTCQKEPEDYRKFRKLQALHEKQRKKEGIEKVYGRQQRPFRALIFFVLFIIINGVLYGFGSAVQKVSESDIEKRAEEEGDKKSLWLLKAMNHPVPIVNTILTTATLLSILTGYIGIRGISPYVYAGCRQAAELTGLDIPSRVIMIVSVIIVVIFALILLVSLE